MNDARTTGQPRPPGRSAIYLSALVLPGAGQFAQRRWIAGTFFSTVFTVSTAMLAWNVFGALAASYLAASAFLTGDANREFGSLSTWDWLGPLIVLIVSYILGLVDTIVAHRRLSRQAAISRLTSPQAPRAVVAAFLVLSAVAAHGSDIFTAIRSNDLREVQSIVAQEGTNALQAVIGDSITPLHLASALNERAIVQFLLAQGADARAMTKSGFTPLHWAASRNAADTAKLLIKAGADVNAKAEGGVTPLHWAASRKSAGVVKLLLAAGGDDKAVTESGQTPLHWAVKSEPNEVELLLAYKAVSREEAADAKKPADKPMTAPSAPPLADISPAAATEDDEQDPKVGAGVPRPGSNTDFTVTLGRGEELRFVWIRSLNLWVGKYEVSNGQYRRFKPDHTSRFREVHTLDGRDQPAVYVSWNQAREFCDWLNKNYIYALPRRTECRLPTDTEWTALARCGDDRAYPWGNELPPAYGNYSDRAAKKGLADWSGLDNYDDGFIVTCPVEAAGTNEWGVCGLGGNVWEWCDDWYDEKKEHKVRRGACWDFVEEKDLVIDTRGFDTPDALDDTIGFRIVVIPKK